MPVPQAITAIAAQVVAIVGEDWRQFDTPIAGRNSRGAAFAVYWNGVTQGFRGYKVETVRVDIVFPEQSRILDTAAITEARLGVNALLTWLQANTADIGDMRIWWEGGELTPTINVGDKSITIQLDIPLYEGVRPS